MKGQSQGPNTPPPDPSHVGAAPSADKAVVLATEHTTRGEEREDGMDGEGRGQRAPTRKQRRANGQCQSHGATYAQPLESSGCCGLQDARQQREGGHAPRSHIAHKRNNEEGEVTTKGPRKIHTPPPSPSHAGAAPRAETDCFVNNGAPGWGGVCSQVKS